MSKVVTKKKATSKSKAKATAKKKVITKSTAKKKTTTKPKTKATTKKKVTKKPAIKRASPKFKRGYKVTLINKELTIGGVKDLYEVYEVTGPKVDRTRFFVDEESVQLFIEKCESEHIEAKALAGKGYQFVPGVMKETKDLLAAGSLPELQCETPVDRYVSVNKEDTDK